MTTTEILATLNYKEVDALDLMFIIGELYEAHGKEKVDKTLMSIIDFSNKNFEEK
jgi:hypothetical protein